MASRKVLAKAASYITQNLTTPSKVAHVLDWHQASGAILGLNIVQDRIELAVASHPSLEEPTMELPSIPLRSATQDNRKVLDSTVSQELAQTVKNFNVCGMIVAWPVQREGWCGKSCGKDLHTLDQIQTSGFQRPVCLYDPQCSAPPEDEWGRTSLYAETSDKTMHVASKEQYEQVNTVGRAAVDIWGDFCAKHWPEMRQTHQEPIKVYRSQRCSYDSSLYKDGGSSETNRFHAACTF